MDAKDYREQLHRNRSHSSEKQKDAFVDQRDSFSIVYLSLIPFLVVEYFIEVAYDVIPAGLIFPIGYLLFWAFYYTYYKPGFLEDKLSAQSQWNLAALPAIVMGVAIWFVKVTVVEVGEFFLFTRRANRRKAEQARYQSARRPAKPEIAYVSVDARGPKRLPQELFLALRTLGLDGDASWHQIQHRYRQLAKKYHPDLNPEITKSGHRFMMFDTAYRKLESKRSQYF